MADEELTQAAVARWHQAEDEADELRAELSRLREERDRYEKALTRIMELGLCNGGSTRDLEARCFLESFKLATVALSPEGPRMESDDG